MREDVASTIHQAIPEGKVLGERQGDLVVVQDGEVQHVQEGADVSQAAREGPTLVPVEAQLPVPAAWWQLRGTAHPSGDTSSTH